MQLGDIAKIKTGLVLSRKKAEINYNAKAKYKLITLKNITDNGLIDIDSYEEFVSNDELDGHYFTKEGDVLMRLSHPHTAVFIEKQHSGLLIPSYFAIIKVEQEKFFPEYIAWYLNSVIVKKELERSQSGSRIPSTNQNVLKTLPVVWITPLKQKTLVELYNLHQKEKWLYKKLIEEKELLFQGISQQMLKDSN
ncbi:restriction endonuclease subunit S [Bacillus cereus]|uniref:restriction endonuclease subunit S n=1 Tax=Bacillus cereus TaxID=1396 RepID=UPI0011A0358F|nr:restriction endonuclease subunit S [Bacillus cereus]MCU5052771.1 restriction endonuclease subunit S [Bacillus cereus]MCU5192191.1 restriction endonuclease subunit S [Bacillus cereus]MCU5637784.1 restriction endonuclease subunit S [Bacillus cereus]